MSESAFYSLFFILVGAILLLAALSNWSYFFKGRKAKFLTTKLGIKGARIFYAFLGSAFIVLGLLINLGVISM